MVILLLCLMQPRFAEIDRLAFRGRDFYTDHLKNLYLIDHNQIVKYNKDLEQVGVYSNNLLGKPGFVDVSNPMKVLAFYPDFNQLVFLDNFLSPPGPPISLDDLGIFDAGAICTSEQGGFWVLDNLSDKIVYFDTDLNRRHESMVLTQLTGSKESQVMMCERNQKIFLGDLQKGILVFDRFGTYNLTLPFDLKDRIFQVNEQQIIQFDGSVLKTIKLENYEQDKLAIPPVDSVYSCQVQGKIFFVGTPGEIILFQAE